MPGAGEVPGASDYSAAADAAARMPSTNTVAVVTDIPDAEEAAALEVKLRAASDREKRR